MNIWSSISSKKFFPFMVMKDFNTAPKNEASKSKQEIYKKEGINYAIKYTGNTKEIYLINKKGRIKRSIVS